MVETRAYEEIIDFIAAGTSPQDLAAFRPSEVARERVAELVSLEKTGALTPEQTSELQSFLQLERIMRLAKARAQRHLSR